MTADELLHLPEDGFRHELLKGELLTFPYHDALHGWVVSQLLYLLASYVKRLKLGRLLGTVGCLIETNPDTVLAADIVFMPWFKIVGEDKFYSGAPTLAVEVLSIDESLSDAQAKVGLWLEAGTKVVWLVSCKTHEIELYWPNGKIDVVTENEELIDHEVVKGLRFPVSEIFVD
jgi:Uma2 family endonuclease